MLLKTPVEQFVRSTEVGVLVRVWNWDDEDFAVHAQIVDRVMNQVTDCFYAGLTTEEMEDDLIEGFPIFEDVNISMTGVMNLEVTLVPFGCSDAPLSA